VNLFAAVFLYAALIHGKPAFRVLPVSAAFDTPQACERFTALVQAKGAPAVDGWTFVGSACESVKSYYTQPGVEL
jgi:hypothetical protein